jgi:hypothetical protein
MNIAGDVFEARISGIPCLIEVVSYSDIEYRVRDRKGYLAPWLERKMSSHDEYVINREISDRKWDVPF